MDIGINNDVNGTLVVIFEENESSKSKDERIEIVKIGDTYDIQLGNVAKRNLSADKIEQYLNIIFQLTTINTYIKYVRICLPFGPELDFKSSQLNCALPHIRDYLKLIF